MSIALMVEVMDHAPAGLTSGERLVLIVIAEWANEKTRVARQTQNWTLDTLCRRAGMERSGLKKALQGLARKGLEVRMPARLKDGKPIYAFEGTSLSFRLPVLAQRGGHSIPTQRQEGTPQPPRGDAVASERGGHSVPHPFSSPQDPSSSGALVANEPPSAADGPKNDDEKMIGSNGDEKIRKILARHGWHDDRATFAIKHADKDGGPKGPRWWETVDGNGDISRILAGAADAERAHREGMQRSIRAREKAAERRAAIDACDICNEYGNRPNGVTCNHRQPDPDPEARSARLREIREREFAIGRASALAGNQPQEAHR